MAAQLAQRAGRGPWWHLLTELFRLTEGAAELQRHEERPWASVTFTGARHTFVLGFTGRDRIAAGEALIEALPEHEFSVPGQLVADATVAGVVQETIPTPKLTVEVELLLLEDC